jgi:arsenite methyltransferase
VVARGEVPAEVRQSMLLWVGCLAGALKDSEYSDELVDIHIEPTRVYSTEDARAWLTSGSLDVDSIAPPVEGKFMSAVIGARKPG